MLAVSSRSSAQVLGHRFLGTLGLQAGTQPETGLYVAGRFVASYDDALFDRNGVRVPSRFQSVGVGGAVGVAFSYRLPRIATYVTASVAVPLAWVSGSIDQPAAEIDIFGVGDIYVQPIRLGWRLPHLDLVTGYAFYIPTGRIGPDGRPTALSQAQWVHELSFGGTVSFDRRRSWQLSALGAYDLNGGKLGIDLTRGDTVQVQGGFGKTFGGMVAVGPVGYALWQVRDDSGSALPAALVGARDQAFGLGAEVDVLIKQIRSQVVLRYTHDIAVKTRPEGQLFLVGVASSLWQPALKALDLSAAAPAMPP